MAKVRINRNIVECKDLCAATDSIPYSGINRNIVECKVWTSFIASATSPVLIETLWNVKEFKGQSLRTLG